MLRLRRLYTTSFTPPPSSYLRIGESIRSIPRDYKEFFERPCSSIIPSEPYSTRNFRLLLHLQADQAIEGLEAVRTFLCRLRFLMRWGHFFWRVSDLNALKFVPIRVVKPMQTDREIEQMDHESSLNPSVEMKVHWQLQLNNNRDIFWIDGRLIKPSFGSLLKVQYYRMCALFRRDSPSATTAKPEVLFTGINRYCFDRSTGLCRELHVERIEPLLFSRKERESSVREEAMESVL